MERAASATSPNAAVGLEVHTLGAFQIAVGGVPLELGTRKARALVALLALEGARSREALADFLWGEFDGPSARKNLRKTLHKLRETPLAAHLDTSGETIACHAVWVDALAFERLVNADDLTGALKMVNGGLLEGLELDSSAWSAWLESRREMFTKRLREVRLILIAQREAAGDLRGALEVVSAMASSDDFDERAVQDAMRLHLRLGDHAAALVIFERFRTLAATMDLQPLGDTLTLAAQAGNTLQAGDRQASSHRVTNALHAPLIGRAALWLHLSAQTLRLSVLTGEPGVGKTRLATEFAAAQGASAIMRGREEARDTPFYPVAELLRDALESGRWSAHDLAPVWRLEVARLVPECAPDALPLPVTRDGRTRFLEGLTQALASVLSGRMLVLDDLHWFDVQTLEFVSHLVRRMEGQRFIATARALELGESEAARRSIEALRRDGLAGIIALEPLAEADVLSLVQSLSGAGGGVLFARRLHGASRGNPLYLLELLRGLLELGTLQAAPEGGWATPFDDSTLDYAELPIPLSLRETVLERVARLGASTQRLLECAALASAPFRSDWLAGIAGDAFARLDALEVACRAGLLEAVAGGFTFRHDLLRRALKESLSPERRRALHSTLADQLEATRAAPERIADHLEQAGRGAAAIPYLERATEAAARVYARREALEYLERMLTFELDDDQRWQLEVKRVGLLRGLTDLEAYRQSLDHLERLALKQGQPDRCARAYLWRGVYHLWHGQPEVVVAQAQRALALPGLSAALEAEGLYLLGHAQSRLGQISLGLQSLKRAVEYAQQASDASAQELTGSVHNALTGAHQYLGEYEQALVHNARADAAWRQASESLAVFAPGSRGLLEILLGRFEIAHRTLDDVIARATQHDHFSAASFAYRNRALLMLTRGDGRAAANDITQSLHLCQGKNLRLEAQLGGLDAGRCWLEGQLGSALGAMQDALRRIEELRFAPLIAEMRVTLAGFLTELGASEAATAELEGLRQFAAKLGDDGVLRPYWAAMETVLARIEFSRGLPGQALERLRATPHLANASFVDRAAHALELAQAMTRCGAAVQALEDLETVQVVPPLEPRYLSVQLEAHRMIGQVPAALLERASQTLKLDCAAPTERLELAMQLMQALTMSDRDLREIRPWSRITLDALALSLESHPELRTGLLARFAPLLEG